MLQASVFPSDVTGSLYEQQLNKFIPLRSTWYVLYVRMKSAPSTRRLPVWCLCCVLTISEEYQVHMSTPPWTVNYNLLFCITAALLLLSNGGRAFLFSCAAPIWTSCCRLLVFRVNPFEGYTPHGCCLDLGTFLPPKGNRSLAYRGL